MFRLRGTTTTLALCFAACTSNGASDTDTNVANPSGQGGSGDRGSTDGTTGDDENTADDDSVTDDTEAAVEEDDADDSDAPDDIDDPDGSEVVEDIDDAGVGPDEDASLAPPDNTPSPEDTGPPDTDAQVGTPPDPISDAGGVVDSGSPMPDPFDPGEFELPEEETCSGVEFVDPEQACSDLAGLSLANPVLVTDADGQWNPGDVATLQIDLVGAPRSDGAPYYVSPSVVALFDIQSSSFASVSWRNTMLFGLNPGDSHTHDLELRLSAAAPPGAIVKLHLEPATSDGHTTGCDCPDVQANGLTLEFEVQ